MIWLQAARIFEEPVVDPWEHLDVPVRMVESAKVARLEADAVGTG